MATTIYNNLTKNKAFDIVKEAIESGADYVAASQEIGGISVVVMDNETYTK